MPLYEYQCPDCGRFERIRKFSDAPLTECPTCGKGVQKLPSAPAIQFKGTGWYITDYARKGNGNGKSETAKSETAKGESPSKSGDSPKTEGASSKGDGGSSAKGASATTSASGSGSSS